MRKEKGKFFVKDSGRHLKSSMNSETELSKSSTNPANSPSPWKIDLKNNTQKSMPHQRIGSQRDNTHFLVLFIICTTMGPIGLIYLLFGSKYDESDTYISLDKYGTDNSFKLDWIVGLLGMLVACPLFYWWIGLSV